MNTRHNQIDAQRLNATDRRLIGALQDGLPLVERPYQSIGEEIGLSEDEVIARIKQLIDSGVFKRFGIVVRHRELGYRANAMVVWDVADKDVAQYGQRMSNYRFVSLCYRRPRILPAWPYNLFCMIHGHDRDEVHKQIDMMIQNERWESVRHEVLFSRRRFKQRGARYINLSGQPLLVCANG